MLRSRTSYGPDPYGLAPGDDAWWTTSPAPYVKKRWVADTVVVLSSALSLVPAGGMQPADALVPEGSAQ